MNNSSEFSLLFFEKILKTISMWFKVFIFADSVTSYNIKEIPSLNNLQNECTCKN